MAEEHPTRKQIEEDLRQSEERYRALFRSIDEGACVLEVIFDENLKPIDHRYLLTNPAFDRLLGTKDAVGKTARQLIPDLDEYWFDIFGKVALTGEPIRYQNKVGIWNRWFEGFAFRIDAERHHIGVLFTDCTRRKQTEDALRESEENLRQRVEEMQSLMDVAPVAIWSSNDPQCQLIKGNRMANTFYQAEPGENISETAARRRRYFQAKKELKPEELPMQQAAARNVEVRDVELDVLLPSGEWRSMLGSAVPLRGAAGQVRGVIAAFLDITQRREREQQLRVQAAALHAAADAIAITDPDGRIQWINSAFEKLTGYSASEVIGKTHRFLYSGRQDAAFYRNLWETVKSGRVWRSELVNKRKDGSFYHEQMSITPVFDERNEIIHFVAIKQDVTERKKAEEEIMRAKENLEQKVRERTAKLSETVAELEHFSYTITHDMRAPLRAMKGFAQILKEESEQNLSASEKDNIEKIITSAARMDNLIRDALNYSKLVRHEFALSSVNVEELLLEMIQAYPEFDPRWIDIKIGSPLLPVLGNKAGLTQCFSNLIHNAIKFAKPGQKPRLIIRSEERGSCVRLWFEDNGIGIPEESKDKAFEMFTQLHHNYPGTGVGLALVRKAAERMDGLVGVESQVGVGSRFWLEFHKIEPEEHSIDLPEHELELRS